MASFTKAFRNLVKWFGPSGGEVMTCSFSLVTTVLTALEEAGCTVLRTGVGTYVITYGTVYKYINVTFGVECAGTAQNFVIASRDLSARTVTIKQVTAGSTTAVDAATARVDLQIFGRRNS